MVSSTPKAAAAGCDQYPPAGHVQLGGVGRGRRLVMATVGSGPKGRADEDVTAARQPDPIAGRENLARHRRHPTIRQVIQIAPVGVPGDHGGRVEQIGDTGAPGQELVEPSGVVVGRPQDHQIRAVDVGIVPGQPTGVQTTPAQRADQPGIVAVTGDLPRTPRQHDAGMGDVRPSEFHPRA